MKNGRQVLIRRKLRFLVKRRIGQHKEGGMRTIRLVLLAILVVLPFAAVSTANAQVGVGIGVGPALAYPGYYAYGPPDCSWGYYSYYPYSCAPYGYYGPNW